MDLGKCVHFQTLILLPPPTLWPIPAAPPAPQEPLLCFKTVYSLILLFSLLTPTRAPFPSHVLLSSLVYKNQTLGPTRERTQGTCPSVSTMLHIVTPSSIYFPANVVISFSFMVH